MRVINLVKERLDEEKKDRGEMLASFFREVMENGDVIKPVLFAGEGVGGGYVMHIVEMELRDLVYLREVIDRRIGEILDESSV